MLNDKMFAVQNHNFSVDSIDVSENQTLSLENNFQYQLIPSILIKPIWRTKACFSSLLFSDDK